MVDIYLDSHSNADKLASAFHRVNINTICETKGNIFVVHVIGTIDMPAFTKVIKRYDKQIIRIVERDPS